MRDGWRRRPGLSPLGVSHPAHLLQRAAPVASHGSLRAVWRASSVAACRASLFAAGIQNVSLRRSEGRRTSFSRFWKPKFDRKCAAKFGVGGYPDAGRVWVSSRRASATSNFQRGCRRSDAVAGAPILRSARCRRFAVGAIAPPFLFAAATFRSRTGATCQPRGAAATTRGGSASPTPSTRISTTGIASHDPRQSRRQS